MSSVASASDLLDTAIRGVDLLQIQPIRNADMTHNAHNKLVSFIWSIADDCLRDVYVRSKYCYVIRPMVVLRRLDILLEPTKKDVLEEVRFQREEMKATELDDAPLTAASGYVFYNTSKWTLKRLYATATNNQQILVNNVEETWAGSAPTSKRSLHALSCLSRSSPWLTNRSYSTS
jgi:type I restriction enzyme M protein